MDQVKVYYDRQGHTLTVWLDDPDLEFCCEETGDEVVLMKDIKGRVIGFEKLNYQPDSEENLGVLFEAVGQ